MCNIVLRTATVHSTRLVPSAKDRVKYRDAQSPEKSIPLIQRYHKSKDLTIIKAMEILEEAHEPYYEIVEGADVYYALKFVRYRNYIRIGILGTKPEHLPNIWRNYD